MSCTTKTSPLISIIIVNWNGYADTVMCLESLQECSYSNKRVLVVDNGSSGDDALRIQSAFPEVHVIASETNLGFSGGNNLGIEQALANNSDYIVLLNNDTTVDPDFLDILVSNAENDKTAGIMVPKINYYSNKDIVWYGGGEIRPFRGSGYTFGDGASDETITEDRYVTFATGCCLLLRAQAVRRVGFMDEEYFLYLEDTDYCQRFLNEGYKIKFCAGTKIYHKVSVSTKKTNHLLPLYYGVRNRFYFVQKFFPKRVYWFSFYMAIVFILKCTVWAIRGNLPAVQMVYKAFSDFSNHKMGKTI